MIKEAYLLFGAKGSGKDYLYDTIEIEDKVRIPLAQEVKNVAYSLLGISEETLESNGYNYERFKTTPIKIGEGESALYFKGCGGYECTIKVMTGLDFINNVGDYIKTNVDPLFWCKKATDKAFQIHINNNYERESTIFHTDVRFKDEIVELVKFYNKYNIPLKYILCDYKESHKYKEFRNSTEQWNLLTLWILDNMDSLGIVKYNGVGSYYELTYQSIQAIIKTYNGR